MAATGTAALPAQVKPLRRPRPKRRPGKKQPTSGRKK